MAKLRLTLYDVVYNDSKTGNQVTGDIALHTDKEEAIRSMRLGVDE